MSAKVIRLQDQRRRRREERFEMTSVNRAEAAREMARFIEVTVIAWLRRASRMAARILRQISR